MPNDLNSFRKIVSHSISGKGAHIPTATVFSGLTWKQAGILPHGAPHSIFQLLQHINYWQDWAILWLDGKRPPLPRHASGSWPAAAGPANAQEWKRAMQNFRGALLQLERRSRTADLTAKSAQKSSLEMLQTIASHNSYHIGQVVSLRQMLGAWPPSAGGLTW